MSSARRRSTPERMTGSGFGDGCGRGQLARSSVDLDGLGGTARSGPGPRRARRRGVRPGAPSPACSGARRGSPRPRPAARGRPRACRGPAQLGEREFALLEGGPPGDLGLGDLEAAGVLVALGGQVVERPLELALGAAGAAVAAADRRLEPVAQGALVVSEVGQLVVADRRGRAEEGLGRDARSARRGPGPRASGR